MKKSLLFLLPLAMLTLTGCDKNKGGSEEEKLPDIVLDYTIFDGQTLSGSSTYYAAFDFVREGVTFATGEGQDVGLAAARTGEQHGYNDNHIMQIRAAVGFIRTKTECPAKSIEVKWWTTYSTQDDSTYFPQAKAGEDANYGSYTTVAINEATPLSGVEVTGVKQGEGDGFQCYEYTTTYTLPQGTTFFSVGAGAGAAYVKSITIKR